MTEYRPSVSARWQGADLFTDQLGPARRSTNGSGRLSCFLTHAPHPLPLQSFHPPSSPHTFLPVSAPSDLSIAHGHILPLPLTLAHMSTYDSPTSPTSPHHSRSFSEVGRGQTPPTSAGGGETRRMSSGASMMLGGQQQQQQYQQQAPPLMDQSCVRLELSRREPIQHASA